MVSAQAAIAKWQANMSAAGPSMVAGVNAVTVAPTTMAAAAGTKYINNVNAAYNSGKWAAGLQSVTLADWKSAMTGKGAQNMASGARALSTRATKSMTDALNYSQTVKMQIAGMPNVTEADADARMLAAVNLMRAYKGTR